MITEDYVSFEIAKLLKEKGFNEYTMMVYNQNRSFMPNGTIEDTYQTFYSAPTLQMTRKWLRDVHSIDISIIPLRSHKEYLPRIESDTISHDAIPCRKYEEACEIAIKYCLENLI